MPLALTIAVSREAGSRGGTVARRVGRKLGWQVYNQELLDHIAQERTFTEGVLANLPADAARWTDQHLQALLHDKQLKCASDRVGPGPDRPGAGRPGRSRAAEVRAGCIFHERPRCTAHHRPPGRSHCLHEPTAPA